MGKELNQNTRCSPLTHAHKHMQALVVVLAYHDRTSCGSCCGVFTIRSTINPEIFGVKIFLDASKNPKI